jgi:hypothetical protein
MNYSPNSRYSFGGELLFRLHLNEHLRYLGHRVLNNERHINHRIGSARSCSGLKLQVLVGVAMKASKQRLNLRSNALAEENQPTGRDRDRGRKPVPRLGY